jgi:hypothetical protein
VAAGSLESIRQNLILGKDTTAVKKPYHMVSREAKTASAAMEEFGEPTGRFSCHW